MELRLHNTLTREIDPVVATQSFPLKMYCCGPTVYGPAHIGNFRTFLIQDLFRRLVEFLDIPMIHVRNITDVDDKTIRQSQLEKTELSAFCKTWRDRFESDCEKLRMRVPHHSPSAVAHIQDQIKLIQTLIDKGHAYQTPDGNVFFRIASFAGYGKLSGLKSETIRHNESNRLNVEDEYAKESWQDFALWKSWKASDGENCWPSP